MVTKTPRSTAKSIKDIVECAIPHTSTVIRNNKISDQHTRAASAAIVSATSTVLSDEKFKRKELLSHHTDSDQSVISVSLRIPSTPTDKTYYQSEHVTTT